VALETVGSNPIFHPMKKDLCRLTEVFLYTE